MATTLNQPTLPAEVDFTEAEQNFIEDSPDGIFPENQNSNFGLLRKAWADRAQELIRQQDTIYNERFVATSSQFLDVWETDVGLPSSRSATRTEAQRRLDVLSRLIKGPFTVPLRNRIIENAITATFGTVPALFPEGIPITAAGIPLYAETASVALLYSVRDNNPVGRNSLGVGNFENNVSGWLTDGTFSGAAISATTAKWGTKSITGIATATSAYFYWAASVACTPGTPVVASAWFKAPRSVTLFPYIQWVNSGGTNFANTSPTVISYTPSEGWKRAWVIGVAPASTASARPVFQFNGLNVGDVAYLDGAQFEIRTGQPTPTQPASFVDPEKTPYYYEVRISNATTPDMASLIRELKRITPASIAFDVISVPPGDV